MSQVGDPGTSVSRAKTESGAAVRVKPATRIGRSSGRAPRTVTIDRLKNDAALAAQTLERHDEAINEWLAPLARELPGQLANLGSAIAKLDATVTSHATLSAEIRRQLGEQDEKIGALEDRGADHEVRITLVEGLPPRVAALEEHRRAATQTEAVTAAVVAQQRQWIAFGIRHGWKVVSALLGLLAAYFGLIK